MEVEEEEDGDDAGGYYCDIYHGKKKLCRQ